MLSASFICILLQCRILSNLLKMFRNVSLGACHASVINPASSASASVLIFPNGDVSSLRLSLHLLPEPNLLASHYCRFCLQNSAAAVQADHLPPSSISGTSITPPSPFPRPSCSLARSRSVNRHPAVIDGKPLAENVKICESIFKYAVFF